MEESKLNSSSSYPVLTLQHNHNKCIELAGDIPRPQSAKESRVAQERPWSNNVLMYVRKSDDVEQILEAIKDSVLFIKNHKTKNAKQRKQYIYMERWALDALESHMSQSGLVLNELLS